MQTIFISIAAYRDPQLVPTVEDCLAKARYPNRLRFGICWQNGPEEAGLPWVDDPRFRIIDVDWRASRGVCWARAELMKLYGDENFYLQLDSHHRFADGWDVTAIDQLQRTASEMPILTAYLTPFAPDTPEERSHVPMQMNFDRFTAEAIVLCRPGELRDWPIRDRPMRARFLSAHFVFTLGSFVRDVPYDPELYFIGEETTLAIRAFTHGYDLFHPTQVIARHEYTREYREHKHWSDHETRNGVEIAWYERDRVSREKVRRFLADPRVGRYGLGQARSFAEYEDYAGLCLRQRRVQDYTRQGFEPPNPPAAADWADEVRSYTLELAFERSRLPSDLSDYRFWYVGAHDQAGQELFRQDADRREVLELLSGDLPRIRVVRRFESDRVPATWTVWPVSDTRGWLPRIDGPAVPVPQ